MAEDNAARVGRGAGESMQSQGGKVRRCAKEREAKVRRCDGRNGFP